MLHPVAAEAHALTGDLEQAGWHAADAAQVAGYYDSSAWRAMAETAAGSAAQGTGDLGRAALFAAARDLYERAGQPCWAAPARRQAAAAMPDGAAVEAEAVHALGGLGGAAEAPLPTP